MAEQVPFIKDPAYVERLLDVCRRHDVRIVIPLIDLDLERLAPHIEEFADIGTTVLCASPDIVDLCFDKARFAAFCRANDLEQAPYYALDDLPTATFPVFYKRRRGFGSIGSGVCQSIVDARRLHEHAPDTLFQRLVNAPELSVDAYISLRSQCIVCVPRTRDKVVAGESYKSRTVPSGSVSELARRAIDALARAGLRGPLNLQIFATSPPSLIEVNARLGSAAVLSNMAVGGRLLDAVLTEACGNVAHGDPDEYIAGMSLTRFLGDVFHNGPDVVGLFPG